MMKKFDRTMLGTGTEFNIPILTRVDPEPVQKEQEIIELKGAKYRLEKLLGVGGMGEVWKAKCIYTAGPSADDDVERDVAVKFVTGLDPMSQLKQSLIREAKLIARLNHENIVRFEGWDYLPEHQAYFVAMEYIDGMDVNGLMKDHNIVTDLDVPTPQHLLTQKIMRIPDKLVGFILFSIANGLDYAHNYVFDSTRKGAIHRDVSPGNVLIKRDEGAVKLGDFGIAVTTADLTGPEGGLISGKMSYISPEGVLNAANVDARSDIYSLGAVAYEMLTGIQPNETFTIKRNSQHQLYELVMAFSQELVPPHEIVKGVDKTLSEIVCKMLESKPEKRYQTAEEFRDAIASKYIYRTGYGPTKFGLRDYLKIRQDLENVTEQSLKNIAFLRTGTNERLKQYLDEQKCDEYRVFKHYMLTDFAKRILTSGKTPARISTVS